MKESPSAAQPIDVRKNALKSKPLVSVIMPVYNGAIFVGSALESVLLQTYENLEIIVVNDGSLDETQTVLDAYAARDSRVHVIWQTNSGVASARNRAIAASSGTLIAPIDADDLWAPDKITKQVRRMLIGGEETGLVYCWWAWIDEAGKILDSSPHWMIEGEALTKLVFINFTGNASVPLFRRRCLEEVGGYNEKLAAAQAGGCEDWEVALRIAARHRVAVLPEVLVGYRRRPGNMSSACSTMWRSQQLVMQGIQSLRPDLKPALFRASENHFAMYLSGLSYWAVNRRAAWVWALRSGIRLPMLLSPYVLRMLLWARHPSDTRTQTMSPGVKLDPARIPKPLLPYDRVGNLRAVVERWITGPAIRAAQMVVCWIARVRLRAEYRSSLKAPNRNRKRVWAMACWHFPIYSQTFVYREVLALMKAGFEVRFAYAGSADRSELPDDCAEVWKIRRRIPLFDDALSRDLKHYQRLMPRRVEALVQRIADASGLTEKEVLDHRHFRSACTFTRMAEAWHADYVHTYFFYEQALYGLVASTLLDLPRGVSCYADHMLADYELKMIALHMQTCDVVVATSRRIRQELEALAGGPVEAVVVKPNGIDASQYSVPSRRALQPGGLLKVVAVNRIHPKKGLRYLLEASALLRDKGILVSVDILGETVAQDSGAHGGFEELQQIIVANGLEKIVRFRGRQTASEVRGYLGEADIFVAPFVELENGDKDGIPTALLEAMAAGCAVIVTDAGSILEVITDGWDGLVVAQRDAPMLASAIERLAGDDGLRNRLSSAAKDRVRQGFDVSRCEGALHDRIGTAIERRNPFRAGDAAQCRPGALRIALLSFEYPPETGFGGIGTYTWYQARALARLGHQVHVIAGSSEYQSPLLSLREHDGVSVFRCRTTSGLWSPLAGLLAAMRCYWTKRRLENAWGMYRALQCLMTHCQYDIVEMPECGGEGALITQFLPLPTVIRLHGPSRLIMPFYDVPKADKVMCAWVEARTIQRASVLNSCSKFLAGEVALRLGIERPVEVIYNGIDFPLFDAEPTADLPALYSCPTTQLTILFAGRMERRKGIHLCGAIAEIVLCRHDVTFLFAGEDLFGYVQEVLLPSLAQKNLRGSIRYLGKLNFQALRAAAKAVDIYLLPSLWENCPYSCLEAMAAGRAIVCSGQGGMPELIEHGVNGLVAETGSPESFAAQLGVLIENPGTREALGAAARQTIEDRFTDAKIAEQTVSFYEACLLRRSGKSAPTTKVTCV